MSIDQTTIETPPRQRKTKRWPWIVGIVVTLLVGIGIGAASDTQQPETVTETVTQEVESQESLDRIAELEAWQSDWQPVIDALVDAFEGIDDPDMLLTILQAVGSDDPAFDEPAEVAEGTIPGPGIFLVGEDIEAGTYRINGDDCYWARLSGVSGDDDIITNGFAEGPYILEIKSSDVAFETSCTEPWVKQ